MILRSLVAQLTNLAVSHALNGVRPSALTDGADLTTWKTQGAYGFVSALIYFDGTAAASCTAPTGGSSGVELWGLKSGQWWLIGSLNGGTAIPIVSDTLGNVLQTDLVGGFDRLFVAGTASVGTVTPQFVPLEAMR